MTVNKRDNCDVMTVITSVDARHLGASLSEQ